MRFHTEKNGALQGQPGIALLARKFAKFIKKDEKMLLSDASPPLHFSTHIGREKASVCFWEFIRAFLRSNQFLRAISAIKMKMRTL